MNKVTIVGAIAVGLVVLAATSGGCGPAEEPVAASRGTAAEAPGSVYGRITTHGGVTYEGPLRWGDGEEAFWGHAFNGVKDENPWVAYVPTDRLAEERPPTTIFGIEIPRSESEVDLSRPFMARFGDIARIESRGDGVRGVLEDGVEFDPDVRVTLKSGTVFDLDRLSASDFDDGVRVWDGRRGVVDLRPREIRTIDLLPNPRPGDVADPLYGTVRTRQGTFTGFLQWDREESTGSDVLVGRAGDGERALHFGTIRSIVRQQGEGSRVTTRDGREVVLSGTRKVDSGNRGVYVDDPRYGRVLVSWNALERVDFSPGGSGPAYDDFPPGRPLTGTVTTRDGRSLSGRLVYDLDESETTETLDAPSGGVDYTIPFDLVASIVLPDSDGGGASATAKVTLRSGEELALGRAGDLGEGNAGVLVFLDDRERPEYVPWAEVEQIEFDRSTSE